MIGFSSYDDWKTTPPPEDDDGEEKAHEEYEQRLEQQEQEEFEQGAIECDERAPWPGDPDLPYACDGCGDMLPQSELHRVRSTSGETDQCERCLGMDGDAECEARR